MAYLREQRLRSVPEALLASGPEVRITDVFMQCGIYDFGRYAHFYKERYGSLPSQQKRRRLPVTADGARKSRWRR